MEGNLDSNKESSPKEEVPLKKDIINIEELKDEAISINKNLQEPCKEGVDVKTSNNLIKNPTQSKLGDETSNKLIKDSTKEKVSEVNSKPLNIKPKKELPIEKKPFSVFVNNHLLPAIIHEFKTRGFEVVDINLKNTFRPVAGDKCWVIYCEIKDICNFWLSFENEDITSLKSISLCKYNQKPSVIESFLIDEKRITLNLIISRIIQRLNGQKLIGIN